MYLAALGSNASQTGMTRTDQYFEMYGTVLAKKHINTSKLSRFLDT